MKIIQVYSPPQRLEGNISPVFVVFGCVAVVAHRNFIVKLSILTSARQLSF